MYCRVVSWDPFVWCPVVENTLRLRWNNCCTMGQCSNKLHDHLQSKSKQMGLIPWRHSRETPDLVEKQTARDSIAKQTWSRVRLGACEGVLPNHPSWYLVRVGNGGVLSNGSYLGAAVPMRYMGPTANQKEKAVSTKGYYTPV